MKKECHYSKPNVLLYRILTSICSIILFISVVAFIYLFFFQDIKKVFHELKKNNKLLTPIYDSPKINIPDFNSNENFPKTDQEQKNTKSDPAVKDAQKIFVAYELGDTLLTSRLIVDFLSNYPDSLLRHKVRLVGAKLMSERCDFDGALNYIQKILGENNLTNEDYSESVLLLGSIARERKQYDSYIQSFLEQAYFRAIEPTKSKLAFYLGYLLLYKGEYRSSLSYFNNVIGEDRLLGLSDLYNAQTMRPERINVLENFLTSYPSSKNFEYVKESFIKEIHLQAQELVNRGYLDSAIRFYTKILTLFSQTKDGDYARIKIAEIYYQKKELDIAIKFLQDIFKTEDESKNPDALFVLGKILFELDRQEESLHHFRFLLEKYPNSPYIRKAQEWQELILESLKY